MLMCCRPSLHKLARPHCICRMQAILALLRSLPFLTAALQRTALRPLKSHQCYIMSHPLVTMTSIWRARQRTAIAHAWQTGAAQTGRVDELMARQAISTYHTSTTQAQKTSALSRNAAIRQRRTY